MTDKELRALERYIARELSLVLVDASNRFNVDMTTCKATAARVLGSSESTQGSSESTQGSCRGVVTIG